VVELPSGTVTFLFTDIEGSSSLWEKHPDAMRTALRSHDEIVRRAVENHVGHVVKSTGDGFHAAFASASDAIRAASDAQLALAAESWPATGPLLVRMAVHTGVAEIRDGDYHGPALNRAARIMSIAHGGQTLVSLATSELVADSGVALVDLGEHRLRGLSRSERVFQLSIPGLRSEYPPLASVAAALGPIRLSPPAFARDDAGFAGRVTALEELEAAWKRACSGTCQMVLVGGEAGIGKTRLVSELAHRAYEAGSVVLYGRCEDESVVPYQPFIEALRPCLAVMSRTVLREHLRGLTDDLVRVFPELGARNAYVSPSTAAESATAGRFDDDRAADRYRLFEAFGALVNGLAETQPVLLILDDLHWADQPTVLLFRHVLRRLTHSTLLVVGCYRDVDLARGHPLVDLLADLRREPSASWLSLVGLTVAESEALLRNRAGRDVAPGLVSALHNETGGNPLFLEELLSHLRETDAVALLEATATSVFDVRSLDLPDTVRDVVLRRLRRLPSSVGDAMTAAAVIGADFDVSVLARSAEQPVAELLDALDQATAAGLVVEDAAHPGRYSFSHALIRQAIYFDLATARRAQLHLRVGMALEEMGAAERVPAVLAHHFLRAVALGDTGRAIRYAAAAGRAAAANVAFEDAVVLFDQALEVLDRDGVADTALRAEVLIDRADALVYIDEGAGVAAALDAVYASRATGSALLLGRAVGVFIEPVYASAAYPHESTALFDEAMAALGEDASALRARLLAIMAFKFTTYQLTGRDGRVLAGDALNAARLTGDPTTLADALLARASSIEGLPSLDDRIALGEELMQLGLSAGARPSSYGFGVLTGVKLAAGDAEALAMSIARYAHLGEELGWLPAQLHAAKWQAVQALMEGRFDDARSVAKDMRRYVAAYRGASGMRSMIFYQLTRELGEAADPFTQIGFDEYRDNLHIQVLIALARTDIGEAAATLEELTSTAYDDGPAAAIGEPAWPAFLAVLTEASATCCEPAHAEYLAAQLAPYAGQMLALPMSFALGAADRYLGMLASLRSDWEAAVVHFERARDLETRARGWAFLPRTRYWEAQFLRARDDDGDQDAALAQLREVGAETSRLGMSRLHAQAAALAAS
jgi:class 3 adenylate cyclase